MLRVDRIDIIELGNDKPFKVTYTNEKDGPMIIMMMCNSNTLKLLDETGGYVHFHIDARGTEEVEPNVFAYVVRVRKYRPPWQTNNT